MDYFPQQSFLVNLHCLNDDKSYNRDFFTPYTIDYGLSFDGIKSTPPPHLLCLASYTIYRRHPPGVVGTLPNQCTR